MEPWILLLGVLATAVASYGAARYAGRAAAKVGEESNAVTFSRDLMARIESLEDQVSGMREELDNVKKIKGIAITLIERLLAWVHTGARKPTPRIPSVIEPFLDESIVAAHKRIIMSEESS